MKINKINAFEGGVDWKHVFLSYSGEYFDKETGTIYLRARYYDPEIGRFITEDTNRGKDSDPLSLNLYTYCYNNPVNLFDSTGHAVDKISVLPPQMQLAIYIKAYRETDNFFVKQYIKVKMLVPYLEIKYQIARDMFAYPIASAGYLDYQDATAVYDLSMGYLGGEMLGGVIKTAGVLAEGTISTQKTLQRFADEVNQTIPGKGSVVGTNKHSLFKQKVDALGNQNLATERTFLNGQEVSYGTKGGVRVDVIEYNANGTVTVYDLKTGNATLTQSRITQIQNAVNPANPSSVTVIQIK